MSSSSSSSSEELPLKPIPGGYGFPFLGPVKDRFDYFYFQGRDEFFRTRMAKYNSTVFRTNMPPGPFISSNPNVVVLLDAESFPVLFDNDKVEKKNVLDGTFMPSTAFTGGHRVCAFLDTSEPSHDLLKSFFLSFLAQRKTKFIPLFQTCVSELFHKLEDQMNVKGKVSFNPLSDEMSFNFVFNLFCNSNGENPSSSKNFDKWLFPQLSPLATLGLPKIFSFFEDLLLHTFPFPFFLVKNDYKKLYEAFYVNGGSILDEAEKRGIPRDEACHNLVFLAGFNAYGGMKILFPALFKWIAGAGEKLHRQLADEIRAVVKSEGGVITFSSFDKMPLTKSTVYEVLRIDPPVPFQYGTARSDLVLRSHDAAFEIKKGEMLFGYQPLVTKDPRVFDNPEEFVGHRFVGKGEKLLKYVFWSNGREIDDPTAGNKQCAGKDLVVLMCRVIMVEFFLRYDTYEINTATLPFGWSITFKSMTKAK